jgi:site-specific DNA-methyltransferase (adenine-specific)
MADSIALTFLSQAKRTLAKVTSVSEVKDIRDRAEAIRIYAKQAGHGLEIQNNAAEIKIRAERRAGELLADSPKNVGGRRKTDCSVQTVRPDTLEQLGIEPTQSHRWQRIASLPEKTFETRIAEVQDAGLELTSSDIVKLAKREKRTREKRKRMKAAANTPRLADPNWKIHQGDCRVILPTIPAGTARLIFADPPYNIGIDYGAGSEGDRLTDDAYLVFCKEWLSACVERLTDDGSLWVMIGDEYADHYGVMLRSLGVHRRAWIKWYETFGVNQANNFNRTSRHIFYCVKNPRKFVFNPEAVTRPSDRQTKYNDKRAEPTGKLWDDVWQIPRVCGTSSERIPDFPTQLPLDLLRAIVGCASDPGDTILDPFSGSATTGAASVAMGRKFIGIEQSKDFCRLATLRLKGIA